MWVIVQNGIPAGGAARRDMALAIAERLEGATPWVVTYEVWEAACGGNAPNDEVMRRIVAHPEAVRVRREAREGV